MVSEISHKEMQALQAGKGATANQAKDLAVLKVNELKSQIFKSLVKH